MISEKERAELDAIFGNIKISNRAKIKKYLKRFNKKIFNQLAASKLIIKMT